MIVDHLFHLFFTISFAIFHHGSQYLANYYCSYQSLSRSSSHQDFSSYFLVFGMVFEKLGVTQHHLNRDSLTLILTFIAEKMKNVTASFLKEMMKLLLSTFLSNLRLMLLDPFFQKKIKSIIFF